MRQAYRMGEERANAKLKHLQETSAWAIRKAEDSDKVIEATTKELETLRAKFATTSSKLQSLQVRLRECPATGRRAHCSYTP